MGRLILCNVSGREGSGKIEGKFREVREGSRKVQVRLREVQGRFREVQGMFGEGSGKVQGGSGKVQGRPTTPGPGFTWSLTSSVTGQSPFWPLSTYQHINISYLITNYRPLLKLANYTRPTSKLSHLAHTRLQTFSRLEFLEGQLFFRREFHQ